MVVLTVNGPSLVSWQELVASQLHTLSLKMHFSFVAII